VTTHCFIVWIFTRILTIVAVFPVRIPAWVFLGLRFVYQLVEAKRG
jgi:hypothetical protein